MALLYLQIVADLADDSQVGLVTFSGHADIYLPLTRVFDKAEIQRKIQATPRPDPRGKTNIADALRVRSWLFRARFRSLARSKLRLCLANYRAGYFNNLAYDWLSIVWAYSEQKTENSGGDFQNVSDSISLIRGSRVKEAVRYRRKQHPQITHNFITSGVI